MRKKLKGPVRGCMRGRTMYVLPFSMGPIDSPMSQIGVQLTDSPYVVVNMRIMARIGLPVFQEIDKDDQARGALHALVGAPLEPGQKDVPWPCNKEKYIVHFPETREIWSYGSGYGGNALLGKKCFALRIASNIARDEGWLAEHMLILGVEIRRARRPTSRPRFPAPAARPISPCWFRRPVSKAGRSGPSATTSPGSSRRKRPPARHQSRSRLLRRRAGHFGQDQSERDGHAGAQHHLHQRRADAGRRRLVGRHDRRAARRMLDWQGASGRPRSRKETGAKAAHPNSRFTAPASQCPTIDPAGKIPTACRSAPSSSAAAAPPPCRWSIRRSTGAPAFISAPPWARK
jgi:phosphoenolpyruvate carboxykinase (GTP)